MKSRERIDGYQLSGNPKRIKMIPAEVGRIKKETLRVEQRIAELRLRAETKAQDNNAMASARAMFLGKWAIGRFWRIRFSVGVVDWEGRGEIQSATMTPLTATQMVARMIRPRK